MIMIAVLIIGCAILLIVLIGLFIQQIVRRALPIWSNDDLPKSAKEYNIHVVSTLSKSDVDSLSKAFLKGSDFLWILTGHEIINDNKSQKQKDDHEQLSRFMIEYCARFAERYGYTLVCHDKMSGEYLGSILLVPPYKNKFLFRMKEHFIGFSMVIFGGHRFVPKELGSDVFDRFETYVDGIAKVHGSVMDNTKHWYVLNLGVTDAAQGKGIGKALIQVACDIVGELPLYLDCHDQNVPYYEKRGFKVVKHYPMIPKKKMNDDKTTSYMYNAMVHY